MVQRCGFDLHLDPPVGHLRRWSITHLQYRDRVIGVEVRNVGSQHGFTLGHGGAARHREATDGHPAQGRANEGTVVRYRLELPATDTATARTTRTARVKGV